MAKHSLKITLLLLLALGLTYCAPAHQLTVGYYREDLSKQFQWVFNVLEILPNQQFAYWFVTDDPGRRYGEGHYRLRGDKLLLTCEVAPPIPPPIIQTRPIASSPDSVRLNFDVFAQKTVSGLVPLSYASICDVNHQGKNENCALCNEQGHTQMRFSVRNPPDSIIIDSGGCQRLALPWAGRSTAYRIVMQWVGWPRYSAGHVVKLHVVSASPEEIVLRFGQHLAVMKKTVKSDSKKK